MAAAAALISSVRLSRLDVARFASVICALVLLAAATLVPPPGAPHDGTEFVLVGVDGATWERIDALSAAGRLPELVNLMEDGRRARLRSLKIMSSV